MTIGSYWPLHPSALIGRFTLIRDAPSWALFGAPIRHFGRLAPVRRRGVEIDHLVVAVEREDARLRAAGEIRKRASFDFDPDHPRRLVDGVGPVIGDAALHHRIA